MKIKILINIQKPNKIEKFYKDGYEEYEKRLSRFCKLQCIYFKKESDLKKHIKEGQKIFKVNVNSKTISSEKLSEKIKELSLQSNIYSEVVFIISNVEINIDIDYENFTISKSSLCNEMEHLILLEQIYRGYKIMNNESYHK